MTASTVAPDTATERVVVASFEEYADAERAVDRLADEGFPVAGLEVVGEGLTLVEEITGHRGYDQAAYEGGVGGALLAGVIGLLFGLLNWIDPLISALLLGVYGVVFGAALGSLLGLLAHRATRGARDFSSVRALRARRYDVVADAGLADEARARIAR